MAERLVNLAKVFVGFIRGGMALVNIVASTMFGCISGSSVADTAAVGSVMIPQMIRERLSAAVRRSTSRSRARCSRCCCRRRTTW